MFIRLATERSKLVKLNFMWEFALLDRDQVINSTNFEFFPSLIWPISHDDIIILILYAFLPKPLSAYFGST